MEPVDRRLILAGAGLAGVAALSRLAKAGPLDPPPGPITPTGKTLQQVYDKVARSDVGTPEARFPLQGCPASATAQFVIDQPGSYYLTGNITGEPGKCCIECRCDHVEIECDGFCFFGAQGTLECIRYAHAAGTPPGRCIGVYDGGFVGWHGPVCDLSQAEDSLVEECWFDSCFSPPASDGTPGRCCALGPGGVCYDCDFRRCTCGACCAVGDRGIVEECVCSECSCTTCFAGATGCVMEDNFCQSCTGAAWVCQDRCTILYNRCVACPAGIDCGGFCVVAENDIDVTLGSPGNGITLRGPRCSCCDNYCGGGGGGGGGIVVAVGGDGALIEDNHVVGPGSTSVGTGNGVIAVLQGVTGCHLARNRVRTDSVSTAFSIAPGNSFGPLAALGTVGDVSAIAAASHPLANFAY